MTNVTVVSTVASVFVVSMIASVSVISNGVSVVCKVFSKELPVIIGNFVKAAVKDDELLLIVVWLVVEMLVVVLGKVETAQLGDTGSIKFIKK